MLPRLCWDLKERKLGKTFRATCMGSQGATEPGPQRGLERERMRDRKGGAGTREAGREYE